MLSITRARVGAAVALACLALPLVAAADDTAATLDETAITALRSVINSTDCNERGGVIIQTATGYRIAEPAVGTTHRVDFVAKLYAGEKLAALYHTHPHCGAEWISVYFSPTDISVAQRANVPSYIGVQWDHTVRRLDPDNMHLTRISEWVAPVSTGKTIGVVP